MSTGESAHFADLGAKLDLIELEIRKSTIEYENSFTQEQRVMQAHIQNLKTSRQNIINAIVTAINQGAFH
jgi:hypothetical protein